MGGNGDKRNHEATLRRLRNGWATGVIAGVASFAGLGFASPALAQQAEPEGQTTENVELVITATRRQTTVQETPIAVTAIGGAQLEEQHIQTFQDLAPLVPGARFNETKGTAATVILRGQYQVNDSPALEVPVGVFIDDIYYGTLGSFDADFFDTDQVAVLRGPQGTTFGRNSVGGAIQVISRRPDFEGFSFDGSLTARSEGGGEARGAFNVPITENLAGRVALSVHEVEGWKNNRTTGADAQEDRAFSLRASLRYQPDDDLDVNFNVSWYNRDSNAAAARLFGQGSRVATLNAAYPELTDVYGNNDGYDERDAYATTLNISHSTPLGTLTSVTGYRTLDAAFSEDIDSTPDSILSPIINRMKEWQFSQELRLASSGDNRIDYVFGVYYGFENLYKAVTQGNNGGVLTSALSVFTGGVNQFQIPLQRARVMTLAPFGEVQLNLTDEFSLTAGLRYTYEEKNGYTHHIGSSVFYGGPFQASWGDTWEAWTPRFIAQYQPTDNLNFYASAARGFKGGGYSLVSTSAAAARIPLEPETSWSYEIGAKTQWFNDALTANIAIYQANTENLQVRSLSNGVFTDRNAGEAEVKGVELETRWNISRDAMIGLNYAYTDARYASFTGCNAGGLNCTGNRIPFTPQDDLSVFGSYTFNGTAGALTLSGDVHYASEVFFTPQNFNPGGDFRPAVDSSAIEGLVNLSALYEPANGQWDLQLWSRNVTDIAPMLNYANFYFYVLTPAELFGGLNQAGRVYYQQPRSFGVTLRYHM